MAPRSRIGISPYTAKRTVSVVTRGAVTTRPKPARTPTATATPTATPTVTATPVVSTTDLPLPPVTVSPSPSPSPAATASPTATATVTAAPSPTATATVTATPSPTATASPTAPQPSTFTLRSSKPDSSNTGTGVIRPVPTQVASSADGVWNNGVLTITKPLKDRIVYGLVKVGANNLTIENCDIRGDAAHPPTGSKYMVDTGGGFTGTVVRYNKIHSTFTTQHFNAIGPRNVVAEFNDISHVTDGFVPSPRNGVMDVQMVIRGNYVHDFLFFGNDPGHSPTPLYTVAGIPITGPWAGLPWNHADAVQVEVDGTTGLNIYGNNFVASWAEDSVSTLPLPNAVKELSTFMLNAGVDLKIEDNWLDGGEYAVNNADKAVTGTFARNKFGRQMAHKGTADSGYYALMIGASGLATNDGTKDQNVWQDTGALVPRRKN